MCQEVRQQAMRGYKGGKGGRGQKGLRGGNGGNYGFANIEATQIFGEVREVRCPGT